MSDVGYCEPWQQTVVFSGPSARVVINDAIAVMAPPLFQPNCSPASMSSLQTREIGRYILTNEDLLTIPRIPARRRSVCPAWLVLLLQSEVCMSVFTSPP